MRRPGSPHPTDGVLSPDALVEEARFILQKLLRDDLFGSRIRYSEAERVLGSAALTVTFADYVSFLAKFGYARFEPATNHLEVTDAGRLIASRGEDPEFVVRITRHFARELGTEMIRSSERGSMHTSRIDNRSSRSPEPLAEEVIDRRYKRIAQIGAGPIGVVHEAVHLGLGRTVAVKEARAVFQAASYLKREEIVRRLKSSVQRGASLVHPGIVQIFDQNHEREQPYFVMEHAAGGNLRARMNGAADHRMELKIVVRVLLQVCHALRFAHGRGVPHLGLKPENLLFDHLGNVKLSDFGFFGVFERGDDAGAGPILVSSGTVGYFAPERLQPEATTRDLGPASDIYSVGIMTYEMLTGRLPGRRSPLPSQARKEVPAAFDDVFDRMTSDALDERYRSVDEVLQGIHRAFPAKDVFAEGTILLWADHPEPKKVERLPEPEVVEVDASEIEDEISISTKDGTVDEIHAADLQTGKVDVGTIRDLVDSTAPRRGDVER
ncbi:MAG: serine/threonine protein kinase [Deltaproteobacteria bacterium]|nr:serine/threonine protein kinase [Deltaproteobacteria bacterium]